MWCGTTYTSHNSKITVVKQRDCLYCGREVSRKPKKYCNNSCQLAFENANLIEEWKAGRRKGWVGKTYATASFVRNYMLARANYMCSICEWDSINPTTGIVPLEINHKDGNPANCKESNLEVLCPNCHALTNNFRNIGNRKSCRNRKPLKH